MKKGVLLLVLLVMAGTFSTAAQDASFCPGAPEARLDLYGQARVTPGSGNNVRELPSVNAPLLGTIPGETIVNVIDGPMCADGYLWWQVGTDDLYGWTVEGGDGEYWLEPYPPVYTIDDISDVFYEGIAFVVDPSLASAVEVRYYDAVEPTPDGPYWDSHPAYDEFRLVDYPTENTYFKPTISIYPAEDYAVMSEYAAEQITAMKALLAQKDKASLVEPDVPLIPIFNAARVFQAKTAYVPFVNGGGFRFITAYSQAIDVLTNDQVFYTYQGLTDDGQYWVSVMMPISTSVLPDEFDYNDTSFDWDAFGAGYTDYITETTASLNAVDDKNYLPALSKLDAMIASLFVTDGSL